LQSSDLLCSSRQRGAEAIARGVARCAPRVLDRGAQTDARGAARYFSQVLDRGAKVVAAAPQRCRSRKRATLLMYSGKE